ncbi:hypothetical protein V6N11_070648 [Hibiscus sabdariffa]|uniref:Uncharacterized protein n=1 Tax=Hibiscus sabdariffa TaxID=183260 RepID=A0ABR2QFM3_9ROSI
MTKKFLLAEHITNNANSLTTKTTSHSLHQINDFREFALLSEMIVTQRQFFPNRATPDSRWNGFDQIVIGEVKVHQSFEIPISCGKGPSKRFESRYNWPKLDKLDSDQGINQ